MSVINVFQVLRKIPDVSEPEAQAAADSFAHAADVATKADIKDMATKADIKDMATKADIKDMATKADIKDMATKADLAELKGEIKAEMYSLNRSTIMWVVGVGISIIATILLN